MNVLDDLDRNDRQGMMNVPLDGGRLLRLLTESIGAKRVVEIGPSNGYSGIWSCLALRKTAGQLITHERSRCARVSMCLDLPSFAIHSRARRSAGDDSAPSARPR